MEVKLHAFITFALIGSKLLTSRSGRITTEKGPTVPLDTRGPEQIWTWWWKIITVPTGSRTAELHPHTQICNSIISSFVWVSNVVSYFEERTLITRPCKNLHMRIYGPNKDE
jgi:hypothetical protein